MAVDKQLIVKKIMQGGRSSSCRILCRTAPLFFARGLEYNPEEAKKLLAEAGYPDGKGFPRFEYTFDAPPAATQTHENIAVELQRMWRDTLGIQMDLREVETKVFWNTQSRLDYQLSRASWVGDYNDANTFMEMFTSNDGNNRTGWKIRIMTNDPGERKRDQKREKIFQKAETMLVSDDAPIIPLFFYVGVMYYDTNKVAGI